MEAGMKFKVSKIVWDTDGQDQDFLNLPDNMEVEADNEDEAVDACTDKTGWCISSATVDKVLTQAK
jgi:hypothetical protein